MLCAVLLTPLALLAPQATTGRRNGTDRVDRGTGWLAAAPVPHQKEWGAHTALWGAGACLRWACAALPQQGRLPLGPRPCPPGAAQRRALARALAKLSAYFWCCPVPAASCHSCSSQGPPRAWQLRVAGLTPVYVVKPATAGPGGSWVALTEVIHWQWHVLASLAKNNVSELSGIPTPTDS